MIAEQKKKQNKNIMQIFSDYNNNFSIHKDFSFFSVKFKCDKSIPKVI